MRSHAFREVHPTTDAEVRAISEQVRAELLLPKALLAIGAGGHGVAEAVFEQERPLFMTEIPRLSAVEMDNVVAVERNRVVLGYRPAAARANRLGHPFRQEDRTIAHHRASSTAGRTRQAARRRAGERRGPSGAQQCPRATL